MALNHVIASGVVPVVRLKEVFRQSRDSRIVTTAHEVNRGKAPAPVSGPSPDSDFYFLEREDPEQIAGLMSKLIQERVPGRLGVDAIRDIQVLCPMRRGSLGAREVNRRLQTLLKGGTPLGRDGPRSRGSDGISVSGTRSFRWRTTMTKTYSTATWGG